jgi:hypothetical protein
MVVTLEGMFTDIAKKARAQQVRRAAVAPGASVSAYKKQIADERRRAGMTGKAPNRGALSTGTVDSRHGASVSAGSPRLVGQSPAQAQYAERYRQERGPLLKLAPEKVSDVYRPLPRGPEPRGPGGGGLGPGVAVPPSLSPMPLPDPGYALPFDPPMHAEPAYPGEFEQGPAVIDVIAETPDAAFPTTTEVKEALSKVPTWAWVAAGLVAVGGVALLLSGDR